MKSKVYYLSYTDRHEHLECHPVGLALKIMRKRNRISLADASTFLNIHRNTLSKYENEESKIPLVTFTELVKLYNVPHLNLCNEMDLCNIRLNINI